MWIDTRDCVPLEDGIYMVQFVYGDVKPLQYTHEGGWNTHYDVYGTLFDKYAMNNLYVVRWYKPTPPKEVPQAWRDEYWKRG